MNIADDTDAIRKRLAEMEAERAAYKKYDATNYQLAEKEGYGVFRRRCCKCGTINDTEWRYACKPCHAKMSVYERNRESDECVRQWDLLKSGAV